MNKSEVGLTKEISSSHSVHTSGVAGGRGNLEKVQNRASTKCLVKN